MLPTATFTIDRPAPGRAVVTIEGNLDVYSAPELRGAHVDLINEGRYSQVFDLSAVKWIDSTGLGVIVGALKGCRARGGELALVVPYEAANVAHALTITGLAKTIPTADNATDALGLLAPKPEITPERQPQDDTEGAAVNDTTTRVRRELAEQARSHLSVADDFKDGRDARDVAAHRGSTMAGTYAYVLAALLGEIAQQLGAEVGEQFAESVEYLLINGDTDGLNDDVMPAAGSED